MPGDRPDLSLFHPLIARWFTERFGEPTAPQVQGWSLIAEGRDTLVAAPTGSGKTLAAFLWSINRLVEAAQHGTSSWTRFPPSPATSAAATWRCRWNDSTCSPDAGCSASGSARR